MKILMTGGTGFIGSALIPSLLAQHHQITALARHPAKAQKQLPKNIELIRQLRRPFVSALGSGSAESQYTGLFGAHGHCARHTRWRAGANAAVISLRIGCKIKHRQAILGLDLAGGHGAWDFIFTGKSRLSRRL